MARAKKSTEVEIHEGLNSFDRVQKEIEGKYGEGIIVSARSIIDQYEEVISVSPALDQILSGGVPKGSWLSVSGPPKTGKTSMLMTLASNFQAYHKGKPRGGRVHYFNVEHRAKKKNIVGIAGLDQSEDRFKVYQSNLSRELAAEQFLEIAITVLKNDPECMVIFDSLSALVEADALTEGLGAETRGKGAKLVTRFVNNTQSTVPVMRSIVCGVNHLIADTGGGRGRIEKTSNRWLYQADIRLKLAWSESWDVGSREIGKKIHWECQESALGPPGMKCNGYLRYGIGLDRVYETLELARATPGLLTTSGNWLEFTFLNEHLGEGKVPKVNGMEKAYRLLVSNPAWVDHLQGKVNSFLRTPQGEGEGEE